MKAGGPRYSQNSIIKVAGSILQTTFPFSFASKCDKETMLQRQYTRDCMKKRNQYMVDCAEIVLAVWNGEPSGTGQAVWYAKEKGKLVWRIDPATLVMEF